MYCSCCAVTCCWWWILCCCCCCCCWWCSCCSRRSPGCSCCNTLFCWLLLCICTTDCCPFPGAETGTHTVYSQNLFLQRKKKKKKQNRPYLRKHGLYCSPFWPLPTVSEDTVIFTGVTELDKGKTLVFAALGLCLGAIDVSVGPTESVILMKKKWKHAT